MMLKRVELFRIQKLAVGMAVFALASAVAAEERFVDVTAESGISYNPSQEAFSTGVAAGDYDNDGWLDLYITRFGSGPNRLYRNMGDGSFQNVAVEAGVDMADTSSHTSLWFDYDGDGWLDLLVPTTGGPGPRLFRNLGDGSFENVSASSGLVLNQTAYGIAGGDYDRDGDIDLYFAIHHPDKTANQLWRNNGDGTFSHVAEEAGLTPTENFNFEFTPSFVDVNNDLWPDLLIVADFQNSHVYLNNGDGTFRLVTDREVITDEGGMGSAIGDYDNDGDLDWFVSSIWDPEQNPFKPWGVSTGNRLYRNNQGVFEDATEEAGVRDGMWGWGSTFQDFNNDGFLDIFHVNGDRVISGPYFLTDPCRYFVSNGDGTFTEKAESVGLADMGLAHGVTAFDYDRDGDLDLFIGNSVTTPKLMRNDSDTGNNFFRVRLRGAGTNTQALGARLTLTTEDGTTQIRELKAGNNYISQDPVVAHFGMGLAESGTLDILWLDGVRTRLYDVKAGEDLLLPHLPVSYDHESMSFYRYYLSTKKAVAAAQADGTVETELASRILKSAVKAFISNRYPASN